MLFGVTLDALFAVLIAVLIAAGAAWTAGATLTAPVFVGILVVVARLTAVASAGADLAAGSRLQHGVLTRLVCILDTPPLPVLDASPPPAASASADVVRAERVSFRYDDRPVLEDVSFVLPRRGLTALVGPSGAGTTTFLRLLTRFWDPAEGHIALDGADLRTLRSEDLYARIGTVLQDDHLLDTTICENIRIARPDASDTDLAAAVRAAGLERTIAELPDGIDSPVGRAGSRLSGGERQRVCVARALLKAAPLTVMDEATSALDPENARLISEAARRLAAHGSVLVIAHNLETVRRADQILVLDHGRIVQRGTHNELAAEDGLYQKLILGGDDHPKDALPGEAELSDRR
ncbi:ABC transporter ATP-binding protein [Actinomadura sp. LOL_016]|uniref:ABC transporter ATP-binding protein n=1 Tax=unclassified Actinomadura TaxID=2626254 RepID=UPI003A7F793A